jgi:hypothetical protein
MPRPSCKALSKPGNSAKAIGLKRLRSKWLLPGERVYRCPDCGQGWWCDESNVGELVRDRGVINTKAVVAPELDTCQHD